GSSDAPSPKLPASAAHGSSCARPPPDPPDPPDPPPLKPPLDRLDLVTLAEPFRMDGPTSSTSPSYTVRFSPSLVSYARWRSRPETITRMPRCRRAAPSSAAWRRTLQVRKRLSPSFHSPLALSRNRGVEATRNLATAWPVGV